MDEAERRQRRRYAEGCGAAPHHHVRGEFLHRPVLAGSAAIAQQFYEGNFLLNAVLTAVILWIGFTAARLITHDLFDRRPSSLTVLNLAHELVTVVVMGLIIGAFGFPG